MLLNEVTDSTSQIIHNWRCEELFASETRDNDFIRRKSKENFVKSRGINEEFQKILFRGYMQNTRKLSVKYTQKYKEEDVEKYSAQKAKNKEEFSNDKEKDTKELFADEKKKRSENFFLYESQNEEGADKMYYIDEVTTDDESIYIKEYLSRYAEDEQILIISNTRTKEKNSDDSDILDRENEKTDEVTSEEFYVGCQLVKFFHVYNKIKKVRKYFVGTQLLQLFRNGIKRKL
ncbi:uncharacterized protein LOC111634751 [Centruroides sculpturatus]|uniref:uncharacterized protein LOC111634751 n=1 Tax=Centruroides sculpturatus TaxID=218467 RepID=UPI000C6ED4E7|nr:uncharacterized protein LOC111634751 [Centruroides sculpturatus]